MDELIDLHFKQLSPYWDYFLPHPNFSSHIVQSWSKVLNGFNVKKTNYQLKDSYEHFIWQSWQVLMNVKIDENQNIF